MTDTKPEPGKGEQDPRSELGLKSPLKNAPAPAQQDPEKGNDIDPRLKEPAGPGQYRSGMDDPDHPAKSNPGQANPAHNTPGHIRRDQPGQHDQGHPAQKKTQSYPGIMGRKARALKEHDGDGDSTRKEDG